MVCINKMTKTKNHVVIAKSSSISMFMLQSFAILTKVTHDIKLAWI
jgi:hypothetical protein